MAVLPTFLARMVMGGGCVVVSGMAAASAASGPPPSSTASAPASTAVDQIRSSAAHDAAAGYFTAHLSSAQRIYGHCRAADLPAEDLKVDYTGRAILRCDYNQHYLPAIIYLMNPTPGNLADRVGRACSAIGQGEHAACGEHLAQHILSQNGGQFVVAGQVIETKAEIHSGTDKTPVYEEFRDGVTIGTKYGLSKRRDKVSDKELADASGMTAVWVGIWGRVPGGSWADYEVGLGHVRPQGKQTAGDSAKWLETVRKNEFKAQDTGDDVLLNGVAMNRSSLLENETLVCNEKCGTGRCVVLAKGMRAWAQALMKCPEKKK